MSGLVGEFVAARPGLQDFPAHAFVLALLDHRPRAVRAFVPWCLSTTYTFPLASMVEVFRYDDSPAPPGLREVLASMQLSWPLPVAPGADGLIAFLSKHERLRPWLDLPFQQVVSEAFSEIRSPLVRAPGVLRTAIVDPLVRQWATQAATRLMAVEEQRLRPPAWPILVADDAPHAAVRRAALALLAPRRGPRDVSLRAATHEYAGGPERLHVIVQGPRGLQEVRLSTSNWTCIDPAGEDPLALQAACGLAFDILNEPTEADLRLFTDWFVPRHHIVVDALRALVAPPPTTMERLAWVIDGEPGLFRVAARRQRPKVRGDGYVKGDEVDPGAILDGTDAFLTAQDRRVASVLVGFRPQNSAALHALIGHPHVTDELGSPLVVRAARLRVVLRDDVDGGVNVAFRIGDQDVPAVRVASPYTVMRFGHLWFVAPADERMAALARAVERTATLPASVRPDLASLADEAAGHETLTLPSSLQGELRPAVPRAVLRLALHGGEGEPLRLHAVVAVVAGEGAAFSVPGAGGDVAPALIDGVRVRYRRDHAAERALAQPVLEALADGNVVAADDDIWALHAENEDALRLLERAEATGVEVLWRDQRRARLLPPARQLRVRVSAARDWLGLDGAVDVDGEQVSLASLLAAVRHQRRYVRLSRDRFAAIDDTLRDGLRAVAALTTDPVGVDGLDGEEPDRPVELPWAAAPALELLENAGAEFEEGQVWQQLSARLARAREVDDVPPDGLRAQLRPYQREGLLFLRRLAAFGTGGVLADDMGLGKTVQAIALLVDRCRRGPAVVVVPTSLVFNWLRELEQFAPSLRPVVYGDAADRVAALAALGPGDVLIATYGLVDENFAAQRAASASPPAPASLGDGDGTTTATPLAKGRATKKASSSNKAATKAVGLAENTSSARFATAIFDEAQAVKNADTQRARACRDLDASLKIALSGTPLENNLGELWSLFRVVCPGLLGTPEQFRRRFLLPIERDRSTQHRRQLGQTVRPFLLRRSKADVLPELPPLTHQLVDVAASPEERAIYDALRLEVLADIDDGSDVGDRRFRVLAGLTRLRLCCCHPVLVEPAYRGASAKLEAAVGLVERVRDAGHKALVFSQFVKFLDLLEPALVAAGVRVLRLDGATPEAQRRQRVDAFQRGDADVFLLSLKAGGAGLNLTAADVVLHLDPWWNPAVEAQAVARAHRMGRAEPVTAVRVVVRDTIEAAILKMHDEKRELIDSVLAGAQSGGVLGLDEIAAMLTARG
jgi:superfamily II DNA or RNA helicase